MQRTFRSFAKINLHLQVVGRRSDGYHELRTIFQTIDLHDSVRVAATPNGGVKLEVDGRAPSGPDNLCHRAAALVLERWPTGGRGVSIHLTKRIPPAAGLGGGSSNAATVLLGVCEVLEIEPEPAALWELARQLGADVPYFLVGGRALGVGRGDEVIPLLEPEAQQEVLLAFPGFEIPTPEVFEALGKASEGTLGSGEGEHGLDPNVWAQLVAEPPPRIEFVPGRNDLEAVVFDRWPAVRQVYNALTTAGAEMCRLSGSGATVFAVFAKTQAGRPWASKLPHGTAIETARTLSRAALKERRVVEAGEGG